ncbi:MAG: chromosome segregation protein SMC [Candidatus Woesearchaeota archaeon]
MTKINKLVMQGFKSFALKTELVFGPGFNCILGPNGSGKSNVLDALCFVLGKSSSKSLRAEKTANLIYNGGKTKQPAKEASVIIYFDNSNNEFPINEKEVKITRTVKQNGNSIYKINDKTVTRNQIVELLSHARINPDGYNIVLQGDIVRIVEMSPIERRQIIEEIAGISIYEEKKQKALNELNKVEEKLKEADIILAEREVYLKELKKDRNQALKFKELDENIKRNKATILFLRLNEKQNKKQELEKDIEEKNKQIKKIEEEILSLKKEIETKKAEISQINKEIEEKGDKDQIQIQKQIEELRVSLGTNKSRINTIDNEILRISDRKKQLEQSLKDINDKIERLLLEKKAFEKSISEKKSQINAIETKISQFKAKYKLEDSSDLEKQIEEIDKKSEQKLAEIQSLRDKQQNLLREKDKLDYQIQSADEKINKVLEVKKENEKELERLKQMRQEFKKATLELSTRLNEDSSITAQLSNARAKSIKIKEELAKLTAKQAGMQETSTGDIALQKILELKKKVKGIYGTVSSLGQVSSEYAVALEVAAGPRIKSIVVDTDATGAECINYLKKNKFGIASFLPLNKIKPTPESVELKAVLGKKGVRGLAIDLIKFEPQFKNVFSYVFGNTLVVENIEVARQIGIGKFRMVTLDGDLTETSGAMHGGFRKKESIGFQERELVSQIEKLEKEDSELDSVINALEKRKAENEEKITRLRHLKAELEAEILKIEKSLHIEDSDLDVSKQQKKEFQEKSQEIETELRKLQNEIVKLNTELAQLKISKQSIRDKINSLKNPALLAELNTFEQKRTELKEEIIKLEGEIKNIDVQINTILQPELDNIKKILKQHEKEEMDFKKEKESLVNLIKNQEKELKSKEETQKEFYNKFKELFKKRDKINNEINEIETKVYKKEDAKRNEELKLNSVSLENAKISAELEGVKQEYKQYEGIPIFENKDEEKIKKEIWEFEKMMQDIGAVNMKALEIYDAVEKEYKEVQEKKTTLIKEKEDVLVMMNEIETKKKDLFMNTYNVINENFKKKFTSLSSKGEATLELESPETIFDAGLNIKVRLTGKKFLDIRSLSGGEKTMTALAFLFAVQDHEPAPFYVLDEVDAALDKRNSEQLAQLIRKYVAKAQYIVISHNDGIISEADNLYGVSMNEHGISKVVSLRI